MKLTKTAALALIISNISAIQLNVSIESNGTTPEASFMMLKDSGSKIRKQAANETVQDNGTLTQEEN